MKISKYLYLIILCLQWISSLNAETYIFTKAGSPYLISQSLTIESSDSLIIEKGVEIQIADNVSFRVDRYHGYIKIQGDSSEHIIIKGLGNNSRLSLINNWFNEPLQYIDFYSLRGVGGEFIVVLGNTKLHHLNFYNCSFCIKTDFELGEKTMQISNCGIFNCSEEACILVKRNSLKADSRLIIENSRFENCSASVIAYYGTSYDFDDHCFFIFKDNKIVNCTGTFDIIPFAKSLITNNLFWNNESFTLSGPQYTTMIYNNVFYGNETNNNLIEINRAYITNCIFWNNKTDSTYIQFNSNNQTQVKGYIKNCIIPGGTSAISIVDNVYTENIYEFDPLFDFTVDSSFKLAINSPAIDAGTNWVLFNDSDGTLNDLGIYGGNGFYVLPLEIDFGTLYSDGNPFPYPFISYALFNLSSNTIRINSMAVDNPDFLTIDSSPFPLTLPTRSGDLAMLEFNFDRFGEYNSTVTYEGITGLPFSSFDIEVLGNIEQYLNGPISGHLPYCEQPYYIENLVINEDDTLFIDPGVKLILGYESSITVYGVLLCGKKDDLVVAISSDRVSFSQININNSEKESIIQNTIIELTQRPGTSTNIINLTNQSSLVMDNITLQYSTVGTFVTLNEYSSLKIINSTFLQNEFDYTIYEEEGSIVLLNNIFDNNIWGQAFFESNTYFYCVNNTFTTTNYIYQQTHPMFLSFNSGIKLIKNNIFWPFFGDFRGFSHHFINDDELIEIDHNIIKGGLYALWEDFEYQNYPNLFKVHNNYNMEPFFKGGEPFDYHLSPDSQGKDMGDTDTWFNDTDGTRNDIGFEGGTGIEKPLIQYNAFCNLNIVNFYWLQLIFSEQEIIDSVTTIIKDTTGAEVFNRTAQKLYESVYKTPVKLPSPGSYELINTIYSHSNLSFSEDLELIIGLVDNFGKPARNSEFFSIVSKGNYSNNKSFYYLAWTKDRTKINVVTPAQFKKADNSYLVKIKSNKEIANRSIFFLAKDSSEVTELQTSRDQIHFYCSYRGEGIYYLAESIQNKTNIIPETRNLIYNYPNPFNNETTLRFSISKSQKVSLKIYDINGKLVDTIIDNKWIEAGYYTHKIITDNLASGVYLYKLYSNEPLTGKMILLK